MKSIKKILSAEQPFLVIGGHAIILHGYPRMTVDLDLLIAEDSVKAWRDLLETAGWQAIHSTKSFVQFEGAEGQPPVDLMIVDGPTFENLAEGSQRATLFGRKIRIPSPEHLIGLKLHAIRQPTRLRVEQDWADVIGLIRSCGLDPEDGGFRSLIDRYGGKDAYDKIEWRLRE